MHYQLKKQQIATRTATLFLIAFVFVAAQQANSAWPRHIIDDELRGADGVKLGDVDKDGDLDIVTGWEESGRTRIYFYPGALNVKKAWPFVDAGETPSVEDAVFFDADGDGWLDVVSSCEGKELKMYLHRNPATSDPNTGEWTKEILPASAGMMQWMFAMPILVSSDQPPALVAAGKGENAAVGLFEKHSSSTTATYKWRSLFPAGWIMSIITVDMDGDSDLDILYSDRKGKFRGCRWLENLDAGQKWRNHLIGADDREVMFITYADLDKDGRKEVIAAVKPDQLLIYHSPHNPKQPWRESKIDFPANSGTAKAVVAADIDKDGHAELIVSCEHAAPPKTGVFALHLDDSRTPFKTTDISGPEGIKFDLMEVIDLDGDGDLDLLTCEERHNSRGLGVFWYENPSH